MQGLVDTSSLEIQITVSSDRTATVSIVTMPKQNNRPTLRNSLSQIDSNNIHQILIAIAAGMKHLHDHALAHMNLNDTSVIIGENGTVTITGLGNARNFANGASKATEKQQNSSTDAKSDVFNFGLLLDELFTKKSSNEASRRSQYTQAPSYVPSSYVSLFVKCLNSNQQQRPTFTQILEELQIMTPSTSFLEGKSVYRPSKASTPNLDTTKFQGVIPAFYACYDKNGQISEQGVKDLTKYLLQFDGIRGLYVNGSSGEGIYQTVEEKKKILEWVMEAKGNSFADKVIIAHVACNNLRDSQILATHAQEVCHVDAIASIPPIYFKLPERSIADYWVGISQAANKTPFIIYNIPQLAGVSLSTSLIENVMKRCPNTLIGVKNSSVPTQDIQKWRDCARSLGRDDSTFIVFNGPDEQLIAGLAIGAMGCIGGTYASMPELFIKAYKLIMDKNSRDNQLAFQIQNDICRIIYKFQEAKGNLYSVMKEVIRLRGGPDCGDVRAPLTQHTQEDMEVCREAANMIDTAIKKYT
ncbi:hypothetical protein TRFO_02968 [Tritrichomonas foetus]|uniref:N-acetylneuraminate lyase n=1 Tax=Tritrichomonas foetus TaxID=1144522 RepID=A0A1J4KTY1_9EUKA|nr:hypothetical protein TRFO_02968 [Tritrichomonas foetus]|eukprot:OHT14719.1 hypothetical protein TRFO_02968 [Tritrichomonas foetus]